METSRTSNIEPVALIFFNRPKTLKEVFGEIKKAKPSKLFLIQDGARQGNKDDIVKVKECRKIVEDIDWDCEVFKNYSDVNLGCGRRPFTGIDWVFKYVDRAIILEDDCVPSQSFFRFCSETLERYSDDKRIFLITGVNMELETKNCKDSYFFGHSGTNTGWASWRRCWENIDYNMDFVNDQHTMKLLKRKLKMISGNKGLNEIKTFIRTNERLKNNENISYWDVQWQSVRNLQNQLSIIPSKNLITNIGVGDDATHSPKTKLDEINTKKGKINFFLNQRYELEFPLKHPKYIIQNIEYDKKVDKKIHPNLFIRVIGKLKRNLFKK